MRQNKKHKETRWHFMKLNEKNTRRETRDPMIWSQMRIKRQNEKNKKRRVEKKINWEEKMDRQEKMRRDHETTK